jgi:hypothetical protein
MDKYRMFSSVFIEVLYVCALYYKLGDMHVYRYLWVFAVRVIAC